MRGRRDRGMTQQDLNGGQVDVSLEEMGCERVTQHVDAPALLNAGSGLGLPEDGAGGLIGHGPLRMAPGEQPRPRPSDLPVGA